MAKPFVQTNKRFTHTLTKQPGFSRLISSHEFFLTNSSVILAKELFFLLKLFLAKDHLTPIALAYQSCFLPVQEQIAWSPPPTNALLCPKNAAGTADAPNHRKKQNLHRTESAKIHRNTPRKIVPLAARTTEFAVLQPFRCESPANRYRTSRHTDRILGFLLLLTRRRFVENKMVPPLLAHNG